jgi:hypothetical protein
MTEQNSIEPQASEQTNPTEEIVEALSESESAIVTEQRAPVNRSTIVTFVVLVIGVASVWFMYQRTGPKSAEASTNSKESVDAKKTINTFLSGGDASIKLMETMLRSTQKVVEQFLSYPSMTQVPLSELRTNPFRIREIVPRSGDDGAYADRRRREEERLAALHAVEGMRLQSIMYSESRKGCMINGGLYVEGQKVEDFIIEKINPSSVVVKSGPYRFELTMQRQ